MSIAFSCPDCGKTFKVPDEMAGKKAKCSGCGVMIQIANTVGITERPSSKSRAAAADPTYDREEEPVAKKRANQRLEDDDEDAGEEEPVRRRRKKKRKKQKKSMGMLVVVGLVGFFVLALLGGGGGLAAWWWLTPRNTDAMKFMPDNCQMILSFKVEELESSSAYQELLKSPAWIAFRDLQAHFHQNNALIQAGIVRIWVGEKSRVFALGDPSDSEDYIEVVQTKNKIKIEDFLSSDGGSTTAPKERVGRYTMYVGTKTSVCLVDDRMLVIANKKETLHSVLDRDKEPVHTPGLKTALDKVNFSKPFFLAASSQGQIRPRGPAAADPLGLNKAGDQVDGFAVNADFDADVSAAFTIFCKSQQSAGDFKAAWDKMMGVLKTFPGVPKEAMDVLASIKLNTVGSTVEGTAALKTKTLIKLFELQNGNRRGGNP